MDGICTDEGSLGSELASKIWTEVSRTGSTGEVVRAPLSLDDLCLAFFSFLLLGRFPKLTPFDILFFFHLRMDEAEIHPA